METTTSSSGAEIHERLVALAMEAYERAFLPRMREQWTGVDLVARALFEGHARERMAGAAQALVLEQVAAVELAEELGVAKTKAAIARGMSVIAAAQPHLRDRARAVEQLAGGEVST